MRRAVLLAVLLLPVAGLAQTSNIVERAGGFLSGLTVPPVGVAVAEEPATLAVNPASGAFNGGVTLQYLHERAETVSTGDGVYLGLGPLTLTGEWVRPSATPRYRKLGVGLGLGGRTLALGGSWNNWSSPDAGIESLHTFDVGLTWRPHRRLSLAGAVQNLDGRIGGRALPVRYQLGAATRILDDALTFWADWLADDDRRGAFQSRALAFGAGYESKLGLALSGQVQFPTVIGGSGIAGSAVFLLSLSFNTPHLGISTGTGGTGRRDETSTVIGVRASSRDYRGFPLPPRAVLVDLRRELDPQRSILSPAPADPVGALLVKLRELARDPEVGTVVVRLGAADLGAARAEELRSALEHVRARKPVVAWLEGGGTREYLVATGASRIEMAPMATLLLGGFSSGGLYLRDTLARIGVAFDVIPIGKYKSAGDPLARSAMSEAEREERDALLDDGYERLTRAVAEARKLPEARVRALVDQALFTAAEAERAGLVDGVSYLDEIERRLRSRGGLDRSWSAPDPRPAQRWGPRPALALIRVAGLIVPGRSRGGPLLSGVVGADTVVDLVRSAVGDGRVQALVVRIESPGGDALASDLVWRSLQEARRRRKPVVISLGDLAASGGYWIATAGDAIVAQASTLTGSIGVVALKPDLSGLLARIDAHPVSLKRGARADLFSVTRPWTPDERAALEKHMRAAYEIFVDRVAKGRRLKPEEVERLAQGRVWSGRQALERGLVDRLGTLEDAIALARERAGIAATDEVDLLRLEPPRTLLQRLAPLSTGDGADDLLARLPAARELAALLAMGPVVALPWEVAVSPGGGVP